MNKTIFFLILAVCVLGMALILLNQRLGRAPEPRPRAEQSMTAETEPAPALPAPAPALEQEEQRTPPAIPDAEERPAERERAAALALEQKEANEALHGTPQPSGQTSGQAPVNPAPAAPPAKAATAAPEPRPAASEAPRTPERATAPAKKPATREKASGPRTITRFVVFARDTGATVRLTGNGPLHYKSMNLENPDRVVLDLDGDWEVTAPAVPKNPLVNTVRVGDMDGRTRIVIDLKAKPRTARVIPAKTGDGVDIRVDQ